MTGMPATVFYPNRPAPSASFFPEAARTGSDYQDRPDLVLEQSNVDPVQTGGVLAIPLLPRPALRAKIQEILAADASPQILRLSLLNVSLPANPGTTLRVFINHPKPDLQVSPDDPHHVRDVAFFCCGAHGPGANFIFEVTGKLRAQRRLGKNPAAGLVVQILPDVIRGPATRIVPGLLRLAVASA